MQTPTIPTFQRCRQESHKFKVTLNYIASFKASLAGDTWDSTRKERKERRKRVRGKESQHLKGRERLFSLISTRSYFREKRSNIYLISPYDRHILLILLLCIVKYDYPHFTHKNTVTENHFHKTITKDSSLWQEVYIQSSCPQLAHGHVEQAKGSQEGFHS